MLRAVLRVCRPAEFYVPRHAPITTGKRPEPRPRLPEKHYVSRFTLPKHLAHTDETWPDALHNYAFKVTAVPALRPGVISAIRHHYPEDEDLLRFAVWLQDDVRDQQLKLRYPQAAGCLVFVGGITILAAAATHLGN